MGLREEKKEQTRREILLTAKRMFLQQGFSATRIRDIADQLNVSEQTVFNYYPSKQHILDALALAWFSEGVDIAFRIEPPKRGSVLKVMLSSLAAYLQGLAVDRAFVRLLYEWSSIGARVQDADEDALRRRPLLDHVHRYIARVAELYEEAQRRKELRQDVPALELAELFWVVLSSAIQTWALSESSRNADLTAIVYRRLNLWMHGVRYRSK